MNNLKDIHNVVTINYVIELFYQDFNEQFEGYTQHDHKITVNFDGCFIRISMNNLKDIHNRTAFAIQSILVVLSGFQ